MNKQPRGFSSFLILLVIAALLIVGFVAYKNKYVVETPGTASSTTQVATSTKLQNSAYKNYVNPNLSIQVRVPSTWAASSTPSWDESTSYFTVASPEYNAVDWQTKPTAGAAFVFQPSERVNASLTTPDGYRNFIYNLPSARAMYKEIKLGGEIAFQEQTEITCGYGCEGEDVPAIELQTVHNGKLYRIDFEYNTYKPEYNEILEAFTQSFTFTK